MWVLKPSIMLGLFAVHLSAGGAYGAVGHYLSSGANHPDAECSDLRCLGLRILQLQQGLHDQPVRDGPHEDSEANFAAFSRDPEANNGLKKRNRNAYDYDTANSMALARSFSSNNHLNRGLHIFRDSDFVNVSPPNCACGYTESTIDLGHLRFPRILPTLECSVGSCGVEPYSCKAKIYKVWVLKQKEPGDSEAVHGPLLPEPLRASYELEMVPVTVACECSA